MFFTTRTWKIDALSTEERATEEFTGTYFQMSRRVTALRNQGYIIQSVTKN